MINWNEVTVGETEIEGKGCHKKIIIGVFQDYVWVNDRGGNYDTYHKDALATWTIYDPWEEITDHRWVQVEYTGGSRWKLMRGDLPIYVDDIHYKSDGRRVWKRKEGQ